MPYTIAMNLNREPKVVQTMHRIRERPDLYILQDNYDMYAISSVCWKRPVISVPNASLQKICPPTGGGGIGPRNSSHYLSGGRIRQIAALVKGRIQEKLTNLGHWEREEAPSFRASSAQYGFLKNLCCRDYTSWSKPFACFCFFIKKREHMELIRKMWYNQKQISGLWKEACIYGVSYWTG